MTLERLRQYQLRILKQCSTDAAVSIVMQQLIAEAEQGALTEATSALIKEFTEQAITCKALAESLREATGDATADAQRTDARRQAYAREDTWQIAANRIAALYGDRTTRQSSRSMTDASTGEQTT